MKRVLLVPTSNCLNAFRHIFQNSKGVFSIFMEEGAPTGEVEESLKHLDADHKISCVQLGMRFDLNGVPSPEILLTEIVNAEVENAVFVLDDESIRDFSRVLAERVGIVADRQNYVTCDVGAVKFNLLSEAFAVTV